MIISLCSEKKIRIHKILSSRISIQWALKQCAQSYALINIKPHQCHISALEKTEVLA